LLSGISTAAPPSLSNTYNSDGPTESYRIENSFSSSSRGINGVLANPAGIARSGTFEMSIGYGAKLESHSRITYEISDESISFGDESENFFKGGLYYTDDPTDAPTNEFRERDLNIDVDYNRGGGVTDMGVAFNFGDVFAVGVTRARPSKFDLNFNGYAPTLFRTTMDLKGKTFPGGLTIEADGRATFDVGGVGTTTADPLYDKFTYNSSVAAVSTSLDIMDQTTDSREIILTFGGKAGDFMWGFNAIPITSNVILKNSVQTKTSSASADMVFYVPDFDPNDPLSVGNWFDEGDKIYTREAGYVNYTMVHSPDAYVYRGVAEGDYYASAMRVDFGLIWQPVSDMSMSLVYENIGGANLTYVGRGVYTTLESYINEDDPPDFGIGSGESWSPLQPNPKPVEDAGGFYLPEEFTIELPRKLRLGISITRPFFVAVDYERYFTDFVYEELTITDVGFLRVGLETSLFGLPLILRGDSEWLLKPTILGVRDEEQANDINDFLNQLPALPTQTTIGLGWRMAGYEFGGDISENHATFLSLYEGDLIDFMKVLTYDLYLRGENWDVTYTAVAEPFYLLSQNAELLQFEEGEAKEIASGDVKTNWVYSLKFGFRF